MNKLSIITINKNNKLGLKKTINSVISQTWFDKIQFIVVDGNSVDGSKEILDPSLYIAISEDDNGIFDAMNKGVKYANGEYCLFLNSSDYLCSDTTIQDIYERLDGTDVISFGINYYPCNAIRRPPTSDFETLFRTLYNWSLPHQATFIKTELLKNRPYDTNFKIIADPDFFFDMLIIQNKSYARYNDIISNVDDSGVSRRSNYECKLERKYMLSKYRGKASNDFLNLRIENLYKSVPIDTVYIAVDNLIEITDECKQSLLQQNYCKTQIIDSKDISKIRGLFIKIKNDFVADKYFVRNLYNNRGFRYSLGRSKPREVLEIEYNKIYSHYNGIYQY